MKQNYFIKKEEDELYHLYTKEGEEVAFASKKSDLVSLKKEKEQVNKPQLISEMMQCGRPI